MENQLPLTAIPFHIFDKNTEMRNFLEVKNEVSDALKAGIGVVALESTIIAHGMPYPENVETAFRMEQIVRDMGCVPATIAIIGGKLRAGLTTDETEHLGKMGHQIMKCSRRDIPVVLARGMDAATTVASTMIIAEMAGIEIFATGGIGGVHRGATESMDISADLQELARTNVSVVSAGAKAILDIGLTLEYLETYGVPVIGYQTNDFPAFYSRRSGFPTDYSAGSPEEITKIIRTKRATGLNGGILIANPIPVAMELQFDYIDQAIRDAIQEAEKMSVSGKAITPWLLAKINELTGGSSLKSNIALVEHNVKLAAMIASELVK